MAVFADRFLALLAAAVLPGGSASTSEDRPVSITLTGSDLEGTGLTFAVASAPAHGLPAQLQPLAYRPWPDSSWPNSERPSGLALGIESLCLDLNDEPDIMPWDQQICNFVPVFLPGRAKHKSGEKAPSTDA